MRIDKFWNILMYHIIVITIYKKGKLFKIYLNLRIVHVIINLVYLFYFNV